MANNDVVDRNKILGSATQDYGFDKVLRGYDIKQVNEYISNGVGISGSPTRP